MYSSSRAHILFFRISCALKSLSDIYQHIADFWRRDVLGLGVCKFCKFDASVIPSLWKDFEDSGVDHLYGLLGIE